MVRGICCLRPGVPGLSERIRVRSLVGRFLEHSRIFRFGSEARGRRYFIGSADLMTRNLDRRVEVVTPIESPDLCLRLEEILATNLADDCLAWQLDPEGAWTRAPRGAGDRHASRAARARASARERIRGSAKIFRLASSSRFPDEPIGAIKASPGQPGGVG